MAINNTLPDWAKTNYTVINPRQSSYFGPVDTGDGQATLGYGTGQGVYSGFGADLFDNYGTGIDVGSRINLDRLDAFLGNNQLVESFGPGNKSLRWMRAPDGSSVGPIDEINYTDRPFELGSLLAMAVTGGNVALANGLLGAGAAGTGVLEGGAAVDAAMGGGGFFNSTAPGGMFAPAATTTANTLATNPALIESAVGSPGYGASSAGAGNAMSSAGLDQLYGMPSVTTGSSGMTPSSPKTLPSTTGMPGAGAGAGTGKNPYASLLHSLFGMYQAKQAKEDYDGLISKIEALNADYGTQVNDQLRAELERRDSAAGRASQYGNREVELASRMYDTRSRNLNSMMMPLSASIMSRNAGINNLADVFAGDQGNVFDVGEDIMGQAKGAWEWVNKTFPDLFNVGG